MKYTRIVFAILILLILPAAVFAQSTTPGNQRALPSHQLSITSNVRGATIYVNGELRRETAPATLSLRRGSYDIRVEARGYLPWSQSVSLTANMSVHAQLTPPYATVVLAIAPEYLNYEVRSPMSQISFYVDGELRREQRVQVPAGWHDIAIASGGLRLESEVFLEAGMVYDLQMVLRLGMLQSSTRGGGF